MSEVLLKENQKSMREYNANFRWLLSNYRLLKKDFKGKSIAVDDKKIIDSDDRIEVLVNRIKSKYKQRNNSILIQYIPEIEYSLTV